MQKKYVFASFLGLSLFLTGCSLTTGDIETPVNSSADNQNTATMLDNGTNTTEPAATNDDDSLDLGSGYSVEAPDGWVVRDSTTDEINIVSGGSPETYHTFVRSTQKNESFAPIFAFHTFTIDSTLTAEQVFGKRDIYSECVVKDSGNTSIINGLATFSAILSINACQAETESFYRHSIVFKTVNESPSLILEAMTSSEEEYNQVKADFDTMLKTVHFE